MYGFGYVWFYENVGDEGLFFKSFRQRLIDCSIQEWSSKLNDSGKARHYKYIMPNFGLACYIMFDIPLKFRIALSKLRCSTHNLLVETGRHGNIAYENRICKLCNLAKIEDEYHFIMECPFYTEFRKIYLSNITDRNITLEMFYGLFQGQRVLTLNLSKYIYFAFEHRNEGIKALTEI